MQLIQQKKCREESGTSRSIASNRKIDFKIVSVSEKLLAKTRPHLHNAPLLLSFHPLRSGLECIEGDAAVTEPLRTAINTHTTHASWLMNLVLRVSFRSHDLVRGDAAVEVLFHNSQLLR